MSGHLAIHSQLNYKSLLDQVVEPGTRWLDVGCGRSLIADWIHGSIDFQYQLLARCVIAEGCDPVDDRPHMAGLPKYVGDCSTLPYADDSFTLVSANMVVEHLDNPSEFLKEVNRILVPGGKFVFHTPNLRCPFVFAAHLMPSALTRHLASWLHGRSHEDIFPTHYRFNTPSSISAVEGFRVVQLSCVPTPLFGRIPVVGRLEEWFIRKTTFRNLQADLIAVLQKVPVAERVDAQYSPEKDLESQDALLVFDYS